LNNAFTVGEEDQFDIAPRSDGGYVLTYIQSSGNERLVYENHNSSGNLVSSAQTIDLAGGGEDLDLPALAVNNSNNFAWLGAQKFFPGFGLFDVADDDIIGYYLNSTGGIVREFEAGQGDAPLNDQDQKNPDTAFNTNGELVVVYQREPEAQTNPTEVLVDVYNTSGTLQHSTVVDANGNPQDA